MKTLDMNYDTRSLHYDENRGLRLRRKFKK